MVQEHAVNYSTIRHILAQYYLFGRTEARKYKYKGRFLNTPSQSKGEEITNQEKQSQNSN